MKFILILLFLTLAQASPIKTGDQAPNINIKDIEGKTFNLKKATQKGPVVLVFYRGGWCPYCNLQLKQLQAKLVPQLKKYNAQLVAISADRNEEGAKTKKKHSLDMTLISDAQANIIKSYKIVNQLPKKLVSKYKKEYKIDIEKASGQKHHIIPVPAVFIVNNKQKVMFSYVNEDYKVRAQIKDILTALSKK